MRRVAVVVIVALLIIAAVAWYVAGDYTDRQFRTALDRSIAGLPPGYAVTYGGVHYAAVTKTARVDGLTIVLPPPSHATVRIKSITVDHPDLGFPDQWAAAQSAPGTPAAKTPLQPFGAATIEGLSVEGIPSVSRVTVDTQTITGPSVVPDGLGAALAGYADDLASMSTTDATGVSEMSRRLHNSGAIAEAVGVQSLEIGGVTLVATSPATDKLPAQTITVTLHSLSAHAVGHGRVEEQRMDGLTEQIGTLGRAAVDHMVVQKLDFSDFYHRLSLNQELSPAMFDGSHLGLFEFDGSTFSDADGTPKVTLGRFAVSDFAFDHGMPTSIGLTFAALHIPRTSLPAGDAQDWMERLGIDTLNIGFDTRYTGDPKARTAKQAMQLTADDLGELAFNVDLTDLDTNVAAMAAGSPPATRLAHALLTYRDHSLANRALKAVGTATNSDAESIRAEAIGLVQAQAAGWSGSPPLLHAAQAVVSFLKAPGTLSAELAPATPLDLSQLIAAETLPLPTIASETGLKVTAESGK